MLQLSVTELEEGQARETEQMAAAAGELTIGLVCASLSGLGQNDDGDIVYTRCDLIGHKLCSIDALNGFPFLQRLCLDGNNLTDLDPLADHQGLVHLSARNNKLDETVFYHLLSSASTLERLNLDGNCLESLNGLSRFSFLMDFSASNNHITAIQAEDFEGLAALMRVQLAENQLTTIDPFAFTGAPNVRRLQLSQNRLQDISFVSYLSSNLDTLLLAANEVSTVGASLSGCKALTTLDLSLNNISSLKTLTGLRTVRTLSILSVAGNPCTRDENSAAVQRSLRRGGGSEEDRPLSRSEIVMDDPVKDGANGYDALAAAASEGRVSLEDSDLETAHYKELSVVPPMDDVHDYAALAAPVTHGLVRHVVAAPREVTIPWTIDPSAELRTMPHSQRNGLWLLHLFPQLSVLNGKKVTPEQVSHAAYLFDTKSPDTEAPYP